MLIHFDMDPTPADPSRAGVGGTPPAPSGPAATPPGSRAPLPVEEIFTRHEAGLVRRLQEFVACGGAGRFQTDLFKALDTGITGLGYIAQAIKTYPPLRERRTLGGRERSLQTLVDGLVRGGDHAFEWSLPTKSVLSRGFGLAKVNFLTSLRYVLEACHGPEVPEILEAISQGIEEAVYTRLAEELLGSLITAPHSDMDLRRLAVLRLVDLWEGRMQFTVDALAPVLRSAWRARTRAVRVFGTMLGTAEILQMLLADCDANFVDWFSRREVSPEEQQAFEEFVFDIPYESLQRVRFRMMEDGLSVVDRERVEVYLGLPPGALRPTVGDPKELYMAFRRRRVRAQYRAAANAPGPRRTAEGYLMEALLRQQVAPADDTNTGP
jgi:hypothetical protein